MSAAAPDPAGPIYALSDVGKQYGTNSAAVHALSGLGLAILPGEMLAVVGASGSGKSTLLQLLGALDRPSSGQIHFEGLKLTQMGGNELADLRRDEIGFIFQQFNLVPTLTALENVAAAIAPTALGSSERERRCAELLDRVGLADRSGHLPSELSGGEQQRVAIARALANRPRVLLADEPTGNLDSTTGSSVLELIRSLHRDEGLTVILVTHDEGIAQAAPRVVRLADGAIVADDSAPSAPAPSPESGAGPLPGPESEPDAADSATGLPAIVSAAEWQQARDRLLEDEKAATRARDALAAKRRRLPMVAVEADYEFEGPDGAVGLEDLFDGRRQLIVYHHMLKPGDESPCAGCSMFADSVGELAHLHARQTSLVLVSRAPCDEIESFRRRMGWALPWYSTGERFNADFGVTTGFGLNVFLRDGESIYRTYFTTSRGIEQLGSAWSFLDLTPLGRQENWEDSPAGWPQTEPYAWWRLHDEYRATGD